MYNGRDGAYFPKQNGLSCSLKKCDVLNTDTYIYVTYGSLFIITYNIYGEKMNLISFKRFRFSYSILIYI